MWRADLAVYPALATIVINFIFTSIVITITSITMQYFHYISVHVLAFIFLSAFPGNLNNYIVSLSKSKSLPATSVSQRQP